MSTKIYNGYRAHALSLNELHDKLKVFRDEAKKLMWDMLQTEIVRAAVRHHDAVSLGKKEPPIHSSYIGDAKLNIGDRFREMRKTNQRDPSIDFEFGLTFIPYDQHIYFMLFTEKDEYIELFKKVLGAETYWYWDNTDPDEDVSDVDWEERGKNWDAVLGDDGIPAQAGYSFDLIGDFLDVYSQFDPEPYIPNIGTRVESFAKDMAADELMPEIEDGDVFKVMSEYSKVIKTDEFKELLPQVRQKVEDQLTYPLTENDLNPQYETL